MAKPKGKIVENLPTGFPEVVLIRYEYRPYYYARIYDRQRQRQYFRSTETSSPEAALRSVAGIYTAFLQNPTPDKRDKFTLTELVDIFIRDVEKRFDRGEIAENTCNSKINTCRNGLIPYMTDMRLLRVQDIKPKEHFKNYGNWRLDKGYRIQSIKTEAKHIREFGKWLYKENYIKESDFIIDIPRQTYSRIVEESGKAFTDQQVIDITNFMIEHQKKGEGPEKLKRAQVLHFYLLMLAGGFRTHELWNLQFRDCQSRGSELTDEIENLVHIRVSKTGPRDTVFPSSSIRDLMLLYKARGIKIHPETSLWVDPNTGKPYRKGWFNERFRKILNKLDMGTEYRLYSCRSTHITDAIERGVSTYILAKNLGTSEKMIRTEYEDLFIQLQTKELFKGRDRDDDDARFKSII
jgi:integrase